MRLEELKKDSWVSGLAGDQPVRIVDVAWSGRGVVDFVCRDGEGRVGQRILFRKIEPR